MEETNYKKFLKQMEEIKLIGGRPKILLHSCCAPCGAFPIYLLKDYFDITIFYNNSNIYPEEEFIKRRNELEKYVNKINQNHNLNIKMVSSSYDNERYRKILEKRKDDKEGSTRCFMCYSLRYKELVEYADANDFDYVSSVMTISRQKDEKILNKILDGYASKKAKTNVLYSNFKKDGGLEKARVLIKENDIYTQKYCGCMFSKKD